MLYYNEDRYTNPCNPSDGIYRQSISFNGMSPHSSHSIQKQQKICKEKGLTVVACFNNDLKKLIKNQIIERLNNLNQNFVSFEKNLHCTFLTLFEVGKPLFDTTMEDKIINHIKNFFIKNNLFERINFTLNFDCIRPGTSKGLEYEHKSDGTVIIYGNYQANTNFICCAQSLAIELKSNFSDLFPKHYNRIAPTVWSTLGYFQEDFAFTKDVERMFNQWRNLYESDLKLSRINIKELKILKTPTKSLDHSEHILTI